MSDLEFDVLLEHLGIADPPLVLRVPSPGRTHQRRRELCEVAWRSMTERGLCHGNTPIDSLRRMMSVLEAPTREVDGRCWAGRSVRMLAAASGEGDASEAVLAVKEEQRLWLRPAAPTGLAREALSVLPEVAAGSGRSVSLPSAALEAAASEAGDDLPALRAALCARGVRADEAEMLVGMLDGVQASGQFGAAVRRKPAGRYRVEHVVGFFDSRAGRYLQLRRDTSSGEPWSTVAPVDRRGLVNRVAELAAEPLPR
ncbi:ESX secretion-associated protein EspG [Actinopolyspora mzabensis]|uniref:ESX secretion-associated protein EspG n=1 Tax=Actinopolyspora mzabensis TaxID=995066 RepID=UPI001FE0296A|nr:ESX secretion-associated protein EspG [Actinopolyspora mzabensis]